MRVLAALLALLGNLLGTLLLAPVAEAATEAAPAGVPRTYDAALAHLDQATEIRNLKRFTSPSGNIYCSLGGRGAPKGCELGEGAIKDPAVCSGNPVSRFVGRVEFIRGRAVAVCNTDTIRRPGAKVLAYGEAAAFGQFICMSESIGVTCINAARTEGFFLRRGQYVIFNAG